jgi:predicted kinase
MAKITPAKPFVLMMFGYPGAGKTFFARQLTDRVQVAHIQADRIRAELFEQPRYDKQENEVVMQLMDYMTGEFLAAGLSVIYDVNMMRLAQRRTLREKARKAKADSLLVWFQIDADTAYNRGQKRDRRRMDDRYAAQLDRPSFDNIAAHMQNPSASEDYAVISGKHVFSTQFGAVIRKMREKGLIRIDNTTDSGLVKPNLVNLIPQSGRVDMTRRNIVIR